MQTNKMYNFSAVAISDGLEFTNDVNCLFLLPWMHRLQKCMGNGR